jgi:hypothetical protein
MRQTNQEKYVANEVIENRSGKFWRGEDSIIRIISYPTAERTSVDAEECLVAIAQLCQGQKYSVLADIRNSLGPINRAERQTYTSSETIRLITALALIVESPLSRIIASFFLGISQLPCPTQVFTSEEKAIHWLRGFVEEHDRSKKN